MALKDMFNFMNDFKVEEFDSNSSIETVKRSIPNLGFNNLIKNLEKQNLEEGKLESKLDFSRLWIKNENGKKDWMIVKKWHI